MEKIALRRNKYTTSRWACAALFAVTLLACESARATALTYDVDAWIDTTDYLYVHGSTLQWEHTTSGAPAGTHGSPHSTFISTTIDGVTTMDNVAWDQTWPSPRPADSFSSSFTTLDPSLPATGSLFATVTKVSGRGTPTIFQQPDASNDNTLIVQFTDGFNSSQYLDAQITVTPEPAFLSLAFGAMGLFCTRTRRRCNATY